MRCKSRLAALSIVSVFSVVLLLAASVTRGGSEVTIDDQQRLLVNGDLFFPLGLYLGPTEDEHLRRIAQAGFNTILCYGYGRAENPEGFLDRAHKHGLWVIYSIKDNYRGLSEEEFAQRLATAQTDYVRPLKVHPALLAWYINDEERPTEQRLLQLRAMHEMVHQEDPLHPTFSVINRPKNAELYSDNTDIIAPDPYPIPGRPVTTVSQWVDWCQRGMRNSKPVWVVPQLHAVGVYSARRDPYNFHGREPTFAEKRCMTYLALLHGAKGVIYYSYMDLWHRPGRQNENELLFNRRWSQMVPIASELNALAPVLLSGRRSDPQITFAESDCVAECAGYVYEDDYYILVVNPSDAVRTYKLTISLAEAPGWKYDRMLEGDLLVQQGDGELVVYAGTHGCDTIVLTQAH